MSSTNTSFDYIELYYDKGVDLRTRTLYMGSEEGTENEIGYLVAQRVIKGLDVLSQYGNKKLPITIKMNTMGGDVINGMAVYDAIRECKEEVHIIVCGSAMSMGAIILQAADKRIMHPHATIMIHYGTSGHTTHSKDRARWSKWYDQLDEWMDNLFLSILKPVTLETIRRLQGREAPKGPSKSKLTKWNKDILQSIINFDTFINAEDAVNLGLVDEVVRSTDRLIIKGE